MSGGIRRPETVEEAEVLEVRGPDEINRAILNGTYRPKNERRA